MSANSDHPPPAPGSPSSSSKPLRMRTDTAEIDSTIIHPGSVKINVQGAFIVDQDIASPGSASGSSANGGTHDTKDIRLPNHTAVVSHIAVDIGGTLAKLVYFTREPNSKELGGRLNFINFETHRIDDCVEFMKQLKLKQQTLNGSRPGELCVMATGGGAYKYHDKIVQALGVDVLKEDEMLCLIIGLDFFITEIPREVFTYSEADPMHFEEPRSNIYPYLLVNIGSGVSMVKVSGPREFQRVGGTSLGGGTMWGLLLLMTGARSFDEMLGLAERGDNTKVDMLVGDIYGTDENNLGLKSTTIASTMGKVFQQMKRKAENDAEASQSKKQKTTKIPSTSDEKPSEATLPSGETPPVPDLSAAPFSAADICQSTLFAISNNIGQLAYLHSEKHKLSRIYFGGSFIRGHRQTMNTLSYAIKFWSNGEKKAYFLRHEGYLGAVGAFVKRQPRNWGRRASFEEGSVEGVGKEERVVDLRTVKGGDTGTGTSSEV